MRSRARAGGNAGGCVRVGAQVRLLGCVAALALASAPAVASAAQRTFATPEAAVTALVAATRDGRLETLQRILGPEGAQLLHSGDSVADRDGRARFVAAYDQAHQIEHPGSDKAVLVVGPERWPLPIPIARAAGRWHFDTTAGASEILDRRIGRNELNAIEVCRAYVAAQREYARLQAGMGVRPQYAQHFMSRPGKRDGLYWVSEPGEASSPLGPLVAQARAAGYGAGDRAPVRRPYEGYLFRIVTRQGAHAAGGGRDFIVDGHMTRGFALIAYPARYRDSGVMTFIVNQDGIVFEKDLGPRTRALADRIRSYDPDSTWRIP